MTGFGAKAWLAWATAAGTFVLVVDNPIATAVALASLGVVAAAFAARAPEGRSAVVLFKLGLVFLALRVVLFGLTGHDGATTLATLPRASLPRWLGGFSVGGRVTAEVLAHNAAEGLEIAALLACLGVFLSVVRTERVLRLLPRFLFEAGLVVGIALTFVPAMLRRTGEVRDAQRLRGHRFRGVRSLRPLVVPVLADGLERSLTLAASMEARGYGRARTGAQRAEAAARAVVLAGLVALSSGGGLVLFGRALAGWPLAVAGAAALAWGLAALSRAVPRTRYRPERLDRWDLALAASSVAVGALALAARALASARWYAYPEVRAPFPDLRLVALAAALAAPAAIGAARSAALRRASVRHPLPAPVGAAP